LSITILERVGESETLRRNAMLIPKAEATFFTSGSVISAPDADELIKFERDGKGTVTGLVWQQKGGDKLTAPKTEALRQEMVQFNNGAITLNGNLLLPVKPGPHPAIVIVSGSGATTRDNPAAFLRAWQFVRMGWAVLLYDKRGTGHPSGAYWSEATYFDWADDAVAAFRFLQQRADINPKQIGFQGNSEAGWVIPIAAERALETAWVIIASGGGITPAESEIHEAEMETRAANLPAEEVKEAVNFVKLKWDYALTGAGWESYEAALKKAQTRAWFAKLNGPLTKDEAAWQEWRRHKTFNPAVFIEKLKVPTLLLFGEARLDRLYPVTEGIAKWKQGFKTSGYQHYKVQSIAGVGHALFLRVENGRTVVAREPFEVVKTWLATTAKATN
jgi:pimeloyl-ACP methyl ester carboxylesterase